MHLYHIVGGAVSTEPDVLAPQIRINTSFSESTGDSSVHMYVGVAAQF
jgi:hypothetical protein